MDRFLVAVDRDGTLVRWVHHLTSEDEMELLPGAGAAIAKLNAAGVIVALFTNQSVVGRGILTLGSLSSLHEHLALLLAEHGGHLDYLLVCPHVPDAGCACRKPSPALLTGLMDELGVSPQRTVLIGDTDADIGAAMNAGVRALRVLTGRTDQRTLDAPEFADLHAAVDYLLSSLGHEDRAE